MENLPVISLSCNDRLANAQTIVKSMENVGFVILDDIPKYDEEKLYKAVKWFFDLHLKRKMAYSRRKWNPQLKNIYRGYFPVDPFAVSFKEGFEVGPEVFADDPEIVTGYPLVESTPWPRPDPGEDKQPFDFFHEAITTSYTAFFEAAVEIIRLLAIGLGLQESFFDNLFLPKTLSTFRILHYPLRSSSPPPDAVSDDGSLLSCSSHSDSGFITLLATFQYSGLQLLTENGVWSDVPPRPGSLVVNSGDILSKMTGNKIKATRHRVVDIGMDRYSCPFFFEPGFHSKIPLSLPIENCAVNESETSITYGPWLLEKMKEFAEYSDILSN